MSKLEIHIGGQQTNLYNENHLILQTSSFTTPRYSRWPYVLVHLYFYFKVHAHVLSVKLRVNMESILCILFPRKFTNTIIDPSYFRQNSFNFKRWRHFNTYPVAEKPMSVKHVLCLTTLYFFISEGKLSMFLISLYSEKWTHVFYVYMFEIVYA